MTQPPVPPNLTPQFCFSTTALRDFLRVSRSAIDDSITQNLNALVTPAKAGFDPSSTARRSTGPVTRQIDPRACQGFKEKVLFPTWQARSHVLSYCAEVATSPDPDDPEVALRDAEDEQNREKIVNERLDPYSARYFPREPRTERLASVLQLENGVENIVRARTWGVIRERCGEPADDFDDAFARWRAQSTAAARFSAPKSS